MVARAAGLSWWPCAGPVRGPGKAGVRWARGEGAGCAGVSPLGQPSQPPAISTSIPA